MAARTIPIEDERTRLVVFDRTNDVSEVEVEMIDPGGMHPRYGPPRFAENRPGTRMTVEVEERAHSGKVAHDGPGA
jgi:hypothetical protein